MKWEEILQAALGFLVVTAILTIYSLRKTKSSWVGYVEDRVYIDDDEGMDQYLLIIRTDQGKKVKLKVFKQMFDEYRKGDRVKKDSGTDFPTKIT